MNKKLEMAVKEKCEKFAKQYWNMDFSLPILYNGRMKNTLGTYHSKTHRITKEHFPVSITFAKVLFEFHNEETVDSVIKHELTHWALGVQGKPNSDHHPVFENEIKKIGASSTGTIQRKSNLHLVLCISCQKKVTSAKTENQAKKYCETTRYTSRCCGSQLVYGGIIENDYQKESYLTQIMNQPKVSIPKKPIIKETTKQQPLTKTEAPKSTSKAPKSTSKVTNTEVKPAQRVKNAFANIMNKLTKKQLTNLTNETFCKNTFGLNYSFIKEFTNDEDRKVNGHNRYYTGTITIFGKQYIICNDIYLKTAIAFENWAK